MKRTSWLLLAVCAATALASLDPAVLRARTKRDAIFTVTDFGAVGDGHTNDTAAVRRAVAAIAAAGGGTLLFPAGQWLTAPFNLTSHCTVFLAHGSKILGSPLFDDWPVVAPLPSYGQGRDHPGPRRAALVGGVNLTDVVLTGDNGTIDGNGAVWWAAHHAGENVTRGHLVELMHSSSIVFDNITLQNSPFWTVHPYDCDQVTARRLTILNPSYSPNTDGFDPDSTSNVLIEDSYFNVGDDGIAIKSGWDCYGAAACTTAWNSSAPRLSRASSNITVRNLTVVSPTSAGLCLGSEMSGGIRNVTLDGALFINVSTGLRVKTARERSGFVRNVRVSNVVVDGANIAVQINAFYGGKNPSCAAHSCENELPAPTVDGIEVSNWTGTNIKQVADLEGLADKHTTGLRFSNVRFDGGTWKCSAVQGTYAPGSVQPAPCDALIPSSASPSSRCQLLAPFDPVGAPTLWPPPHKASNGSASVGIMPELFDFQLAAAQNGSSVVLDRAFARYRNITFPHKSGEICGYLLPSLDVTVDDISDNSPVPLAPTSEEAYELQVPTTGDPATLHARNVNGALRGLATFAQLVSMNDNQQYGVALAPWTIAD